jgi:hypothetical protein
MAGIVRNAVTVSFCSLSDRDAYSPKIIFRRELMFFKPMPWLFAFDMEPLLITVKASVSFSMVAEILICNTSFFFLDIMLNCVFYKGLQC